MSRQDIGAGFGPHRQPLAAIDPLVLEAVADVDRGLLRWSLQLSPRERLRSCSRSAAVFARLRRAASGVR